MGSNSDDGSYGMKTQLRSIRQNRVQCASALASAKIRPDIQRIHRAATDTKHPFPQANCLVETLVYICAEIGLGTVSQGRALSNMLARHKRTRLDDPMRIRSSERDQRVRTSKLCNRSTSGRILNALSNGSELPGAGLPPCSSMPTTPLQPALHTITPPKNYRPNETISLTRKHCVDCGAIERAAATRTGAVHIRNMPSPRVDVCCDR